MDVKLSENQNKSSIWIVLLWFNKNFFFTVSIITFKWKIWSRIEENDFYLLKEHWKITDSKGDQPRP